MRWGMSKQQRESWHPFYAIWPRCCNDGRWVCFEWIERRGAEHEYRTFFRGRRKRRWNYSFRIPESVQERQLRENNQNLKRAA